MPATLPKEERLSGKTAISALVAGGRWGGCQHIRYCWTSGNENPLNRMMVSVPKKNFKRAVKRNLLKRRIREAYRTQKDLLVPEGVHIMFVYSSQEIAGYEEIRSEIAKILTSIK